MYWIWISEMYNSNYRRDRSGEPEILWQKVSDLHMKQYIVVCKVSQSTALDQVNMYIANSMAMIKEFFFIKEIYLMC